jgi:hypothetical protein
MLDDSISNAEVLYRAVPNIQAYWIEEEQRLTSAVFSDSLGVSVDRDGGRSETEIIASFDRRFSPDCGIVSVTAQDCVDNGAFPMPKPEDDNPYHAYIQQSVEQVLLTKSTQRKLQRCCKVIRLPAIARKNE